jgi:hypothetical protein
VGTLLFWALFVALAVGAWLIFGIVRRTLFEQRVERARKRFDAQHGACEAAFLRAAQASGKPRGLHWRQCELGKQLILARDRANGEIVGLSAATIQFEAIAGGNMEDVEAVGNLRAATAIFTFDGDHWNTQGRAVFNLEPREVLERYRENLDPI